MRHLSVELLKESPSPALRTCAGLAQLQVSADMGKLYIGHHVSWRVHNFR